MHPANREGNEKSPNGHEWGYKGGRGGEKVNPEFCFYGGAFPLSQYSKEQELSGDFLPKQYVKF